MSDLREAAQQALEAMDRATRFMSRSDYRKLNEAITALKAVLAQKQAEPVQERVTTVSPITPGVVGVMPITTVPITVPRVLTDADLDAIREIVREGGKK